MYKKEETLQFVNGMITDMEAKHNRSDQDSDELELWKIHRDQIMAAASDEALCKRIVFMRKTMVDLGLGHKLRHAP
ncbi:hypothetical protein HF329_17980 [Chitinophaga oryzae]|uniref:Uncharacterized protein n=1 Tax=Chitinophaga oryzae TaxID=2725414 RepID=A0AAE7D8S3_9BACT|nr:hypothetical protein [Chitinophaga oryzae]QJB33104.1 hypothetical protein HF329_17980 [Chitinophaga oryzae]